MQETMQWAVDVTGPVVQALVNGSIRGAALAIVALATLWCMRRKSAATRYAVCWAALIGTVALLALGFAPARTEAPTPAAATQITEITPSAATSAAASEVPAIVPAIQEAPSTPAPLQAAPGTWALIILAAWAAWTAWRFAQLGAGFTLLKQRRMRALPASPQLQSRLEHWARMCGTKRKVACRESDEIGSPMLIGLGAPLIVFPASLSESLTGEELDQILLHELAHVERWDDWTTLAQRLLVALCGPNPLTIRISRKLDLEREVACDEAVVAMTGRAKSYALCLTRLSELSTISRREALAPAVAESRSQLTSRIERLVRRVQLNNPAASRPVLMALACALIVLLMQGNRLPELIAFAQSPAPEPPAIEAEVPPVAPAPPAPPAPAMPSRISAPVPPAPPAAPLIAQAPPAPPSPPSPASPPAPPAPPSMVTIGNRGSNMQMNWSDGSRAFQIRARGVVEFTDDDKDVKSVSDGGMVVIEEDQRNVTHRYEVRSDGRGGVIRMYSRNGKSMPIDADGRAWLDRALSEMIEESGMGAPARVRRILSQRGPVGLRAMIQRIRSDGAKRRYLEEWVNIGNLSQSDLRDVMILASKIGSDGDKRALLVHVMPAYIQANLRGPWLETASHIGSDGDKRATYSALVAADGANRETLEGAAKGAAEIGSDGDKAHLLIEIANHYQANDALRSAYFRAVDRIGSDGDKANVLLRILEHDGQNRETVLAAVRSARRIGSDGDKANVLTHVTLNSSDETLGRFLFEAIDSIGSDGDRARVLLHSVAHHPPSQTAVKAVESAQRIGSDGDKARILVEIARNYKQDPQVTDAIRKAISSIGSDGEYRRVNDALR